MSKQLIERLRGFKDTPRTADNLCHEAADRIEELERANQHLIMALADAEALEIGTAERCDALQADNARLREVLVKHVAPYLGHKEVYDEVLASIPAQSLARLRNQVRDECYNALQKVMVTDHSLRTYKRCLDAIHAMKEPE